jgi:hypothetical protein
MHSTVPNTSELTRFSIDFRTVDARDTSQTNGAPNIDSESTGTTMMDYLRGSNLSHFPDEEIQRYRELTPQAKYPTPQEVISRAMGTHA